MENLTNKLKLLKAKIKKAKQPETRKNAQARQQKFIKAMSEAGKKRACFFLSSTALAALKKRKAETKSVSLNHTLETLLTAPSTPARTEVATKILTVNEPTAEQKIILEQARKVAETFKIWKQNQTSVTVKNLGEEAGKLAELF